MKLSLVVPCYDEEGNIESFFEQFNRKLFLKTNEYEYIFVDDGSKDKTFKKLKNLCKNNPEYNIHLLSFSRNFGKEAAMLAGLEASTGDFVCIVDADLQQPPETVNEMYKLLSDDEDLDCITACQVDRSEGLVLKNFKKFFYAFINKISDVPFVDGASDFRMMRSDMVNSIVKMKEYHRFSKGLFSFVGYETKFIPYTALERAAGKSKWNFLKLFKYAIEGIVSFSTFPLKIASISGVCAAILSMIYLVFTIVKKIFFGINVSGYATIVVLILLLGGIQLFCLGMLGEYVGRTYVQSKERPVYIIKEEIKHKNFD